MPQLLDARLDARKIASLPNIAELLSEKDLKTIGLECKAGYDADVTSREQWSSAYAQSMELALQVVKKKSFPWDGASNVRFPLLTIAALNWHAKAYPAIVHPTQVVKAQVLGPANDPDGARYAAACRVGEHMSYLLLEDSDWEEQVDQELLALPILGTMFRKIYYSDACGKVVSELVFPKDLVVDYYTTSLDSASRISHIIPRTKNEIYEREEDSKWIKNDYGTALVDDTGDDIEQAENKAHKVYPPIIRDSVTPYEFIEQACSIDLDGDGYREPYYVIFDSKSGKVAKVWARYTSAGITERKNKIIRIKAQCCYQKIPFIPSPDGSFYDLGFGLLLGPTSHSVDTLINMLIDAGTMANTGGGFLGRGVKVQGGNYRFKPQEWKRVESTGEDLNKSIYPLPVREPSTILFNLLTYLVDYSAKISGSTDVQVGDIPGDNAKTGVLEIANENGRAVFSATFKRVWRAHKREFQKLYDLISIFFDQLSTDYKSQSTGKWLKIQKEDYKFAATGIVPAADPIAVSRTERLRRAQMVLSMAQQIPGHNLYEVVKRVYYEMGVEGVDQIYPDPSGPNAIQPQPDVKMLEVQVKMQQVQIKAQEVQLRAQEMVGKLQQEEQLIRAKVIQLLADAELKMSMSDNTNRQSIVAEILAQVEQEKVRLEGVSTMMDLAKGLTSGSTDDTGSTGSGQAGSTGDAVSTMADSPGNAGLTRLPTVGTPEAQGRMG